MWRNTSRPGSRRPGPPLRVKLAAVLLCLLAAAAAVIVTAGASALRGQLIRQAGAQLRVYANQLTSHPFQVLGTTRGAPMPAVPFDGLGTGGEARAPGSAGTVGAPGAARMAGQTGAAISADAPGTMVAGIDGLGAFSIELRGPSGQLLLSAGPGTRPGQPVPAPFARVPARTGVLRTVRAAGGDYLVLAVPVHVQARRLAFGYGADDFAVTSGAGLGGARTGGARTGPVGRLVVGLRLAGIGNQVRRLTLLAVAVSAAAILAAVGLAWAAVRLSLRPVTRATRAADAVAANDPAARVPPGDLARWLDGGLAGPLHSTLSQLDARSTACTASAEAARSATARMSGSLESVAEALRRPVSLLHGVAEHWAHRDRRGTANADRALDQVATEAAGAEALLDQLDSAVSQHPG